MTKLKYFVTKNEKIVTKFSKILVVDPGSEKNRYLSYVWA
jgi:hypothetical protein